MGFSLLHYCPVCQGSTPMQCHAMPCYAMLAMPAYVRFMARPSYPSKKGRKEGRKVACVQCGLVSGCVTRQATEPRVVHSNNHRKLNASARFPVRSLRCPGNISREILGHNQPNLRVSKSIRLLVGIFWFFFPNLRYRIWSILLYWFLFTKWLVVLLKSWTLTGHLSENRFSLFIAPQSGVMAFFAVCF